MTALQVPALVREPSTAAAFINALLLVGLLIAKEFMVAIVNPPNRVAARILDVALAPLLVVFIATIAFGLLPMAR